MMHASPADYKVISCMPVLTPLTTLQRPMSYGKWMVLTYPKEDPTASAMNFITHHQCAFVDAEDEAAALLKARASDGLDGHRSHVNLRSDVGKR